MVVRSTMMVSMTSSTGVDGSENGKDGFGAWWCYVVMGVCIIYT